MTPTRDATATINQIRANGHSLLTLDRATWSQTFEDQPVAFQISADSGQITFTVGNVAPLTATVFDPASHWQKPRSLRVMM
jgi:hypothetical protein